MKRYILFFLALLLMVRLCGCGKTVAAQPYQTPADDITEDVAEEFSQQNSSESDSEALSSSPDDDKPGTTFSSDNYECLVLSENAIAITKYTGDETDIAIPDVLAGYYVTEIGENAFRDMHIESVKIPGVITSIGDYAFAQNDIASVEIPDSVSNIGANPFNCCMNLSVIRVSPRHPYLATIDGVLFSKAEKRLVSYPNMLKGGNVSEYNVPQGIKIIGDGALEAAQFVTTVEIPDSLREIGREAFAFSPLEQINLPGGLVSIGDEAFYYCTELSNVLLPSSLTAIGSHAFGCCESINMLHIPENVTNIGENPFISCYGINISVSSSNSALEYTNGALISKNDKRLVFYCRKYGYSDYTVQEGIEVIGGYAFEDCSALKKVVLPDSVTRIDNYAFFFSKNISEIEFSDNLLSIGDYAFLGCSQLVEMVLPESLQSIGAYAFDTCVNLKSVLIPVGVTEIGEGAFTGADSVIVSLHSGSNAEKFCAENNIKYVYSDEINLDWLNN